MDRIRDHIKHLPVGNHGFGFGFRAHLAKMKTPLRESQQILHSTLLIILLDDIIFHLVLNLINLINNFSHSLILKFRRFCLQTGRQIIPMCMNQLFLRS